LTTLTPTTFWSSTIALKTAPVPFGSLATISGTEKYSFPPSLTITELILPFIIDGSSSAPLPLRTSTVGFFSKFKISDPYDVPFS